MVHIFATVVSGIILRQKNFFIGGVETANAPIHHAGPANGSQIGNASKPGAIRKRRNARENLMEIGVVRDAIPSNV